MFSIFFLCSFLAWFISNLSEPYESTVTFDINYTRVPDSLSVSKGSRMKLDAKVKANGFAFLYYNFYQKKIELDLAQAKALKGRFYYPNTALVKTIEKQLSSSTKLVAVFQDTLFLNVFQVTSKKVEIKPNITLSLEQNYLMDGPLMIDPQSITLKGPEAEIASVQEIITESTELVNITSDFDIEVKLALPDHLENTTISSNTVRLSGKVVRFSEKVFEVEIQVLNSPEGLGVKTFPNSVSVLCKAPIEALKTIKSENFEVVANYQDRVDDKLFLNISARPQKAYDVRILENQVNFILEKQ